MSNVRRLCGNHSLKIPGAEEWTGYADDIEVRHAHKLFFGRSLAEVQRHFGNGRSIERADELLFMPRRLATP